MKVKTLIERLKKCDPEAIVVYRDWGSGSIWGDSMVAINHEGKVGATYHPINNLHNFDKSKERLIYWESDEAEPISEQHATHPKFNEDYVVRALVEPKR